MNTNKNIIIPEKNGLELIELGSDARLFGPAPANEMDGWIGSELPEESLVVAWLDYKVLAGRKNADGWMFCENETFENRYVRRMRVFTPQKELLIWRTREGFRARTRIDDLEGAGTYAVVARQALYGTDTKESPDENFSVLVEKRGTRIAIPFGNVAVDENKKRVFIETRNYIDVNGVGQYTYVDCAFGRFVDHSGNSL